MNPDEYKAALATLGISQLAAGRWLGVTPRTAHNWAKHGCKTQSAVMMVRVALACQRRVSVDSAGPYLATITGDYVHHDDLAPLLPSAAKGA